MIYREVALPDPLSSIALCAWSFALEPCDPQELVHSIPPDGTTNLVLTRFPQGTLQPLLVGPSLAAVRTPIARGFAVAGLRLRPEAASCIAGHIPVPNHSRSLPLNGDLAGLWFDLADLIDHQTDWCRTTAVLGARQPADPAMSIVVSLLLASSGRIAVSELAVHLGVSERQLRRRFRRAAGISPKQYAGVQRSRRALILALTEPNWADVALTAGFSDQPHLARDIKSRFGTASQQVSGYLGGIRHEFITPLPDRFVQDVHMDAA